MQRLLPKRNADSNKGTYGKLLMITGSKGMSGAAYLGALAATGQVPGWCRSILLKRIS